MKAMRLSDQVAEQLEGIIRARNLAVGDRLPSERQLAQELGVSRSSLREAIQQLVSKGLLVSRVGGGTFVQSSAQQWSSEAIVNPLSLLFRDNPEYRFDVLEIRYALEGAAAFHAAQRAQPEDHARIRACFDAMMSKHGGDDSMDEARADAAFHLSIAEASHNLVLLQVMRGLFDLLQIDISKNLEKLYTLPRVFEPLSAQHRELMDAILAADPERARNAAHAHLDFVRDSLKAIEEDEARLARASRLASVRP